MRSMTLLPRGESPCGEPDESVGPALTSLGWIPSRGDRVWVRSMTRPFWSPGEVDAVYTDLLSREVHVRVLGAGASQWHLPFCNREYKPHAFDRRIYTLSVRRAVWKTTRFLPVLRNE